MFVSDESSVRVHDSRPRRAGCVSCPVVPYRRESRVVELCIVSRVGCSAQAQPSEGTATRYKLKLEVMSHFLTGISRSATYFTSVTYIAEPILKLNFPI